VKNAQKRLQVSHFQGLSRTFNDIYQIPGVSESGECNSKIKDFPGSATTQDITTSL